MEKDKKVTALYCRLSKDDGSNSESLSIRTQTWIFKDIPWEHASLKSRDRRQ